MLRRPEQTPTKKKKQQLIENRVDSIKIDNHLNWWFQSEWLGYFLQTPQPPHGDNRVWSVYVHKVLRKKCDERMTEYKLKNIN